MNKNQSNIKQYYFLHIKGPMVISTDDNPYIIAKCGRCGLEYAHRYKTRPKISVCCYAPLISSYTRISKKEARKISIPKKVK